MELWAIAVYDFGLTDDHFLRLTPAKFAALSDRHDQATRHADLRIGVVASVIANVNRDEKTRPDPYTAHDFFPDPYGAGDDSPAPKKTAGIPEMTDEQILRYMKSAFPKKLKKATTEAHG